MEYTEHKKVVGGHVHYVRLYNNNTADVWTQPLKPGTQEGWQAHRDLQHFEGKKAHGQAMVAWLKRSRVALKSYSLGNEVCTCTSLKPWAFERMT